jgi:hypothetical protein
MKRPIAVCLAAVLCAGCHSAGQTTDPFFGRSTLEAPRTGTVASSRAPAYYSGAPATTTPRAAQATTTPARSAPAAVGSSSVPATRPGYGGQMLTSSPTTPQSNQHLIPATGPISSPATTLLSPTTIAPPATVAPTTAAPIATTPAKPAPVINSAPLVPIDPAAQPATGPTLRPAAAIPAPAMQGQCYPFYPRYSANPACTSLADRPCIVRPLQARPCTPCPPGTVPVACVPAYNPCAQSVPLGNGALNLTDLPEAKTK